MWLRQKRSLLGIIYKSINLYFIKRLRGVGVLQVPFFFFVTKRKGIFFKDHIWGSSPVVQLFYVNWCVVGQGGREGDSTTSSLPSDVPDFRLEGRR